VKSLLRKGKEATLSDGCQIVLDFGGSESFKTGFVAKPDFDVVLRHLTFEGFLEGEDGGVNGILQLQLFVVTLLEERLPADEVLANRSRFPREIRTRWIALKEVRSFVVPANEKHRDAERSNAALLRVFLHDAGHALNQLHGGNRFLIRQKVVLRQLSGSPDQQAVVGAHSAVHHADVFGDLLDLADGMFVVQDALLLLLRGHDDAIRGFDSHGRRALFDSFQGILDLD